MARDFTATRRLLLAGLALLIGADVFLGVYSWSHVSSPDASRGLAAETARLKLLRADVESAQRIQRDMPKIQKDCDRFELMLFPSSTGYSSVSSDLDGIAQKAGLQIVDLTLKQKEDAVHGLTKVDFSATVNGDYASIVRFVNGIQRSQNLYDVESLTLAGETQNASPASQIKVTLHMQTYFRANA